MKKTLTIFFLIPMMCSCLEHSLSETDSKFSTTLGEVEAAAEFLPDSQDSVKTVRIISNRSWYAHLNDVGDPLDPKEEEFVTWAKLDISDHANLTNVTDTVDVNITFSRNFDQTPVHGVLNVYSEGEKVLSLPIKQNGAVYHLSATADKASVSCLADTVKVFVDCNTSWNALIAEETTADVVLANNEGFDPDTLIVAFRQNLDAIRGKDAKIILSAESCEDVIITLSQDKAFPYLSLVSDTHSKIPSGINEAEVVFRTNSNWTIRSTDESTLSDISFDRVSGGPSSEDIKVRFSFTNPGDDPHIVNYAKFVLSAEGNDDVLLEFSQRSPLKLDFNSAKTPPYGLLSDYSTSVYNITLSTSISEYQLPVTNCKFREKSDGSHGLQIPQNGSLGLPGIEGLKISSVIVSLKYHSSFRKIRLVLCSSGETVNYYTGVLPSYLITEDWVHTFHSGVITEPETKASSAPISIPDGTGCVLLCDKKDMNNLIKTITIVYEATE